jgi:hypothetical protein
MFSTTLPAGDYFIGDPCYVVQDHEQWLRFLDNSNYLQIPKAMDGDLEFYAASTRFGDGTYEDEEGFMYPVDAGIIGITSLNVIMQTMDCDFKSDLIDKLNSMGRVISPSTDLEIVFKEDGVFVFKTHDQETYVRIDTDYIEDEYNEYEDEEECEE